MELAEVKKQFIVFVQHDEEGPIEASIVVAGDHQEAEGQAEIVHGYNSFLVLDEIQARKLYGDLTKILGMEAPFI